MTIGFNVCTIVFILSPSVPLELPSLFLPVNITIASVLACRLYRELGLGLLADPIVDGVISKVIFKNTGNIHQQHRDTFELHSLDDMEYSGTDSGR